MKILFLTTEMPHAGVISGHRIVYERIKRMAAKGHRVGLASFIHPRNQRHLNEMREHVFEQEVVPFRKSLPRTLTNLWLHGIPPPFAGWYAPRMKEVIGDMVERSRYDAVIAEYSMMGLYLFHNPYLPAVRTLISCHQCAVVAIRRQLRLWGYGPRAWWKRAWFDALQQFELHLYRGIDRLLVLTGEERTELLSLDLNVPISVAPSGVDPALFSFAERSGAGAPKLVFTANYRDEKNRDAALWFAREVFPCLRQRHERIQFTIIGPHPTHEILDLEKSLPGIRVTGEVDDVRPYLWEATLFICPMRMGSGLQGKVLEAMACGAPVVSTYHGMEGIPAYSGHHCCIADCVEVMVESISFLLEDKQLRHEMARRARALVEERFSWDACIARLENIIDGLLRGCRQDTDVLV